jgi:hypothetical protein
VARIATGRDTLAVEGCLPRCLQTDQNDAFGLWCHAMSLEAWQFVSNPYSASAPQSGSAGTNPTATARLSW